MDSTDVGPGRNGRGNTTATPAPPDTLTELLGYNARGGGFSTALSGVQITACRQNERSSSEWNVDLYEPSSKTAVRSIPGSRLRFRLGYRLDGKMLQRYLAAYPKNMVSIALQVSTRSSGNNTYSLEGEISRIDWLDERGRPIDSLFAKENY